MVDLCIQEYNKKARTKRYLMNYIQEKCLVDGARIPSENRLVQKLKFSRGTIRHAIGDLVSEGILERRSGSGTFLKCKRKITIPAPPKIHGQAVFIAPGDDFFSRMASAIEKVFHSRGLSFLHLPVYHREDEMDALKLALNRPIDGILLSAADLSFYDSIASLLQNIPFVFVNHDSPHQDVDCVSSNDSFGSYNATRYLISLGHRKILHLAGPAVSTTGKARLNGYLQAIKERGLEELVLFNFLRNCGILKSCGMSYTAIFCYNDFYAASAIHFLQNQGFRVPNDISVLGYGNILRDIDTPLKLTTVDQNPELIGQYAAKRLIAKIFQEDPGATSQSILTPTQLIIRDSCTFLPHCPIGGISENA